MHDVRPSAALFLTIVIAAALADGGLGASDPPRQPLPAGYAGRRSRGENQWGRRSMRSGPAAVAQ